MAQKRRVETKSPENNAVGYCREMSFSDPSTKDVDCKLNGQPI